MQCGHTFEKESLKNHLSKHKNCPVCRKRIIYFDFYHTKKNFLISSIIENLFPSNKLKDENIENNNNDDLYANIQENIIKKSMKYICDILNTMAIKGWDSISSEKNGWDFFLKDFVGNIYLINYIKKKLKEMGFKFKFSYIEVKKKRIAEKKISKDGIIYVREYEEDYNDYDFSKTCIEKIKIKK